MDEIGKEVNRVKEAVYQVENRQFIVRRKFGTEKTIADLIFSEVSHSILQNKALNNPADYGIINL